MNEKILAGLFVGIVFSLFFINWAYWAGVEKGERKGERKALKWILSMRIDFPSGWEIFRDVEEKLLED